MKTGTRTVRIMDLADIVFPQLWAQGFEGPVMDDTEEDDREVKAELGDER